MATSTNGIQQYQATTVTYKAEVAIAIGDIVTLGTTAGEVVKASTEATGFGVAASEAAAGESVAITIAGLAYVKCGEAFSSLTGLPRAFVNDTDGYAHAAATNQRMVGFILPTSGSGTAYADLDLALCLVAPSVFYAA